jgi:hypothetical protein
MAELEVDGDELVVRLGPWERIGTLRTSDVRVSRRSIIATRQVDRAYDEVRGLRAPGTGLPGRILIGTWLRRGGRDFVAVSGKGPGVVIELSGERFDRIVTTAPVPAEIQT